MPNRLGNHHSEETKQKMRLAHLDKKYKPMSEQGRKNISEAKKGCVSWSKGKIGRWTKEQIENNKLRHMGLPAWNKGLTKNDDNRLKIISIKQTENWKDEIYRKMISSAVGIGSNKRPNRMELKLIEILNRNFPNEWKYTGDLKFWIEHKNPDFVNCNGKKLIIEFDGIYWHQNNKDRDGKRNELYTKYGYRILSVNEDDLRDEKSLTEKIKVFSNERVL